MIDCEFLDNGTCQMAGRLAAIGGVPVPVVVSEQACTACLALSCPRTFNRITCSLAIGAVLRVDQERARRLGTMCLPAVSQNRECVTLPELPPNGKRVGTRLKQIFARVGIGADGKCECDDMAYAMDVNGPEWCTDNLEWLVGIIARQASKRLVLGALCVVFPGTVEQAIRKAILEAIRTA